MTLPERGDFVFGGPALERGKPYFYFNFRLQKWGVSISIIAGKNIFIYTHKEQDGYIYIVMQGVDAFRLSDLPFAFIWQ